MKYLLILPLFILACSSPEKEVSEAETVSYDSVAISLNNQGVNKFLSAEYDSALYYYDLAIAEDDDYYLPHMNKSTIYLKRKQIDSAHHESKIATGLEPELPEVIAFDAMIKDYIGQKADARQGYEKAISLYDARIENQNEDKIEVTWDRMNRAVMNLLLGNEEVGMTELRELRTDYAEDEMMRGMLTELMNFEKEAYLTEVLMQ